MRTRDLTGDPAAMRALAHPLRLSLLELLASSGPMTATEAGRQLGQAPGNMSWHLRVLARHGFVVESEPTGGRRRPWALTAFGHRWDPARGDEDLRAAETALLRVVVERSIGQLQAWLAARHTAPASWQRASDVSDWTLYLTAAEAERLREQMHALFATYAPRLADPSLRPRGSRPVKVFVSLHPSLPLADR